MAHSATPLRWSRCSGAGSRSGRSTSSRSQTITTDARSSTRKQSAPRSGTSAGADGAAPGASRWRPLRPRPHHAARPHPIPAAQTNFGTEPSRVALLAPHSGACRETHPSRPPRAVAPGRPAARPGAGWGR
ncbi:hypothetical protein AKJ13_19860 [Methylobacterium sp. ARG-1]|nr:hypothetical protein AKJ13_19860 [Methylobacterium sp. ARG-1]